jgi:fatty-acid desaturase
MRLSLSQKFQYLHIFTHLCALYGVYFVFSTREYYWIPISIAAFLYIGIFGVNIGLHRYFAHHSFKTGDFGYWLLLFSSFLPMLGSPVAWGSVHLYHHRFSDTSKDPHSPHNAGRFGSWFTVWPKIVIPLSLYRNFIRDQRVQILDKYYFSFVIAYVLLLFVISPKLVLFLFAIPAVGCFHGAAAIAVLPHLRGLGGYRNHETDDNSQNSFLAWVLSLGEGWHNNHHNNAKKYRQGELWWELDPSAFIIKNFLMKEK